MGIYGHTWDKFLSRPIEITLFTESDFNELLTEAVRERGYLKYGKNKVEIEIRDVIGAGRSGSNSQHGPNLKIDCREAGKATIQIRVKKDNKSEVVTDNVDKKLLSKHKDDIAAVIKFANDNADLLTDFYYSKDDEKALKILDEILEKNPSLKLKKGTK